MSKLNFINKLKILSNNAYAPYSNFRVVAFFENENDEDFYGVNIENASYPNTMCAERVAIHSALNNKINIKNVKAIHIYSPDSNDYLSPCGGCRQTISEHINNNTNIYMYNKEGNFIQKKFSEIFPYVVEMKNIKGNK